MFKPVNFDSTKSTRWSFTGMAARMPQMILNSWNGGWRLLVPNTWQKGLWLFSHSIPVAAATVAVPFEQAIFRHLGKAQMDDMMSAVDYLKSLSYTDTSNMWIVYWASVVFDHRFYAQSSRSVQSCRCRRTGNELGILRDHVRRALYGYTAGNPDGYEETNLIQAGRKLKGKPSDADPRPPGPCCCSAALCEFCKSGSG